MIQIQKIRLAFIALCAALIGCGSSLTSLAQGGVSTSVGSGQAPASQTTSVTTSTVTTRSKPKHQAFHRMKAKKAKALRRKSRRAVSINGGKLQGGVSRHHKPFKRKTPAGTMSSGQAKRMNKLNAFLKNPPPSNKKLPEIGEPGTSVPQNSP